MKRFIYSPVLWGVLLILLALVGSYVIFGLPGQDKSARLNSITPFPGTTLTPPPPQPYAAVNPDVAQALLDDNPFTNPHGLGAAVPGVPVVGVYLPSVLDAPPPQIIEIVPNQPTPLPSDTPTPAPTRQPAPAQPDVTRPPPTATLEPIIQPYSGDGCAPAGRPIEGVLTQRFHRWHTGIDIGSPIGTSVVATHSGVVTFAGWNSTGYGYLVILQNGSFITYYAHLNAFNVTAGQQVGSGSVIAFSGNSGNSTGPHVHYETRIDDVPVDPLTFHERQLPHC